MGDLVNGKVYNLIAWTTTILVTVLALVYLVTTVFPQPKEGRGTWFG